MKQYINGLNILTQSPFLYALHSVHPTKVRGRVDILKFWVFGGRLKHF